MEILADRQMATPATTRTTAKSHSNNSLRVRMKFIVLSF
jgi:hypothetical protein